MLKTTLSYSYAMSKTYPTIIIFFLAVVLIGCKESEPLTLPKPEDISKIEIIEGVLEQNRTRKEIVDPKRISQVLRFIESNNTGWHSPWGTYPKPQITVVFRNLNNNPVLILWFGTNWIGGQSSPISPKKAYLWKLDESRMKELKQLME